MRYEREGSAPGCSNSKKGSHAVSRARSFHLPPHRRGLLPFLPHFQFSLYLTQHNTRAHAQRKRRRKGKKRRITGNEQRKRGQACFGALAATHALVSTVAPEEKRDGEGEEGEPCRKARAAPLRLFHASLVVIGGSFRLLLLPCCALARSPAIPARHSSLALCPPPLSLSPLRCSSSRTRRSCCCCHFPSSRPDAPSRVFLLVVAPPLFVLENSFSPPHPASILFLFVSGQFWTTPLSFRPNGAASRSMRPCPRQCIPRWWGTHADKQPQPLAQH